jgi:N-acetylglucosamine-6-phosphate deacetylase
MRIVIRGGDVVLPDRVAERHSVVIEDGRITAIVSDGREPPTTAGETVDVVDVAGTLVLPGFVDVHVHGAAGHDVLDGPGAVAAVAAVLPRFGVTAWCPTSVACSPESLDTFLTEVAGLRAAEGGGARVLGAHLESNFINPEFRGAQPAEWIRAPADGHNLLDVIRRHRAAVATVTMAPEIAGGAGLLTSLVADGFRVSLGHSAATVEEAEAAFSAGARGVTHLFNRMPPLAHRSPGLAGAALARDGVVVEVIGDGWHVHPSVMRTVWAAKGPGQVAAITDGTAGSGCPAGSRARIGGREVTVGEVARLDDGTVAGSVTTMTNVWVRWVNDVRVPLVDATRMCATTPAAEAGRPDLGRIVMGAPADLVAVDAGGQVRHTWVGGVEVFGR